MLKAYKRKNLRVNGKDAIKAINELMGWEDITKSEGKQKQQKY